MTVNILLRAGFVPTRGSGRRFLLDRDAGVAGLRRHYVMLEPDLVALGVDCAGLQ